MDLEQLEKRLDTWKKWLLVAAGASATYLAMTVFYNPYDSIFGSYFVFLALWLTETPLGFILLMSKKWRQVPLAKRLNIAFGFLGCAWLALLGISFVSNLNGDRFCISVNILSALILGSAYFYLRNKQKASEEMFP